MRLVEAVGYLLARQRGKTCRLKPGKETRLTTAAKAARLAAGAFGHLPAWEERCKG
jgi:hypothetical protein